MWPLLLHAPLFSLRGAGLYRHRLDHCRLRLVVLSAVAKHTVSQVTPFSLLTPVFGITFGELFFHEALTWQVMLGGAMTIAGVAIIVIRRPKLALIAEAT